MSDENSKTGTEVGLLTDEPVSVGRSAQQPTQAPSQPEPQSGQNNEHAPLLGVVPIPSLKVEDATMEFHMEVKRPESSSSSHDPWKTFSMSMATQYLSHGGR